MARLNFINVPVPAAGTPVQVTSSDVPALEVVVSPISTNTSACFLAGSGVTSTEGLGIFSGAAPVSLWRAVHAADFIQLNELYVDSSVNDEGLVIGYRQ